MAASRTCQAAYSTSTILAHERSWHLYQQFLEIFGITNIRPTDYTIVAITESLSRIGIKPVTFEAHLSNLSYPTVHKRRSLPIRHLYS